MGWVKMKLGEVLKNREGRYKPKETKIAGLKRIDKINFSGQVFLSDKGSNTDMIIIKKGDLVISGINVEKGALAVYEGEDDILATIHYSSYIFDTAKIDIDFLKVFLRSPDFIQLLKEQVPGGIKTEIKPKHILPLEVYFPETTTEQKSIAQHFFEKEAKFNQLKEHISYQLTQLENLNQAILQEAVQGKLVQQDPKDETASELFKRIKAEKSKSGKKEKPLPPIKPEEIPFEIPENWVWCRIGKIANLFTGNSINENIKNTKYKNINDGLSYIGTKDVEFNGLGINYDTGYKIPLEEIGFRKAKPNSILICIEGGSSGKKYAITDREIYFGNKLLASEIDSKINPFCLYYFYQSYHFRSEFKVKSKGLRGGVSINQFKEILIPLPPLSEQKRIVAEIEKQLAKTKQLKEHIIANQQATEQLLKALLHQAFEVKEMGLV